MNTGEYVRLAVRTEANNFVEIADRINSPDAVSIRLLHAAIGLCTEAGELQDALKKHIFYGKPLDRTNLIEELGDLMWYVAIACDVMDVGLDVVMELNIAKLKARYPDRFTEKSALDRDLQKERKVLEGGK